MSIFVVLFVYFQCLLSVVVVFVVVVVVVVVAVVGGHLPCWGPTPNTGGLLPRLGAYSQDSGDGFRIWWHTHWDVRNDIEDP